MYKKFITPNQNLSSGESSIVIFGWIALVFLMWNFTNSTLFPAPMEVFKALGDLILHRGVFGEFLKSILLCLKAMGYAILVSLILCYISVLPVLRPLASFSTKLRFLPTAGLTFLFLKLADGEVSSQKIYLLVFGISVFFVTSIMGVIEATTIEELNYARTLRFSKWRVVWEVIILGKLDQVFEAIRQNFAMAWMMIAMVENLCKSDGGIGVIISDQNKYFKFDYVWAIQLLILGTGIMLDWLLRKAKNWILPYSVLTTQRK